MAYYKVLIEVWCDWDPADSNLKEIVGHVALREGAICTLQEVVRVVNRPQDIENDAAMAFLAEKRAMQTKVRGRREVVLGMECCTAGSRGYAAPLRSASTGIFQALSSHSGI